jgi:putative ABC transport system permease protein
VTIKENIKISLTAIKSQATRTTLTALIIAIGIMALVGTLTSIDAIKNSLTSSFSSMGSNSFTIRNSSSGIRMGGGPRKTKVYNAISYHDATLFKQTYDYPALISISNMVTPIGTLKFENEKTNPNITTMGVDDNYLEVSGYKLKSGRNFSVQDLTQNNNICILGKEIEDKLFTNVDAIDKFVRIGSSKYRVVGVLEEKGSSMGFGGDKICMIPISHAKQYYSTANTSYTITVKVSGLEEMEAGIGQATGMMRNIRKDANGVENSFEITQSDSLSKTLFENLATIRWSAIIIGIITLLGAAIGLMNIMLVSVTERTREIGIRKSLGATSKDIQNQFLTEAIVICQLGGILGIFLGFLIGNLVGASMGGGIIIPWLWITVGFLVCFVTGLVSGIYPAIKASKLDPIEAMRYE